MTNEERKQVVTELLAKRQTLSQIQDHLHKEKNDPITYMELRLLLSEMPDAKLPEKELLKTLLPPAPMSPPPVEPPVSVPSTPPAPVTLVVPGVLPEQLGPASHASAPSRATADEAHA